MKKVKRVPSGQKEALAISGGQGCSDGRTARLMSLGLGTHQGGKKKDIYGSLLLGRHKQTSVRQGGVRRDDRKR